VQSNLLNTALTKDYFVPELLKLSLVAFRKKPKTDSKQMFLIV
jgi:hypothetical protein